MATSERELTIKICGKADSSLNTVSKKVDKAFRKITSAAKTLAVTGGSAVVGATVAATKIGKEYEAQMSTVQAISGASAKEYEQLDKKAQQMGATTVFTAKESAQAMEYMAMAGWKTKDMLGGVEGIMNLAAASGEELGTVSDIVTDALTAFNLTAEDSGHFADVLAAASSNSNTNVSMMGETFKYAASVAGSLGYSAEDTAVSIGLLANAGIKASQGGTIIRKLMSETAGGINLVSKAYAKHGEKTGKLRIETANADGSMKDWSETVGRLREEFSKMTEEEQAANAESIGGKTAMAGLLSIVNASEKDYKKLTKSIKEADGAAEKMSKIRMDNLEGDIKLFQSALEGKGIELYNEIKEPMRDIVQNATDWLEDIDVGRVVDEFENFGGAVAEFAEPLLGVGEWMLDNPEVISGVLGSIGGAITGFKLLETVPKLADGLDTLLAATAANPYLVGGSLAVGVITGIGTAVAVTERKLENASLEEHFGDIALSMDKIKQSAEQIVGAKTLGNVRKLFDSFDETEQLDGKIEKALNTIEGMEWKISAGLQLDKSEMSDFEEEVKKYVAESQKLLNEKGYTVNVATKVLLGNSAEGKELIEEDNAFFASLSMEASGLADRINNTLEEAMKKGLTPDLQGTLDGYLEELEAITTAQTKAESEAKWDTLQAEFSGKDLDADSWEKMQEAVKKNVEEIEEGERKALETSIKNSNWKKELGYISEEENEQEKKMLQEAYEENLANTKNKAAGFFYNTLMDTYGEEIASGNYDWGDKGAIGQIVSKMSDLGLEGGEGTVSDVLDKAFNGSGGVLSVDDLTGMTKQEEYRMMAKEYAAGYINGDRLDKEAEKVGNETAESLRTSFSRELAQGIKADTTLSISGTYTASFSGDPYGNRGISQYDGKSAVNALPGHATGTISKREHIARVSEGNKLEAIIPIDGSERSRELYEATGKLMGITADSPADYSSLFPISQSKRSRRISSAVDKLMSEPVRQNVSFEPHNEIHVHVSGSASAADGRRIGDAVGKEVEKTLARAYRKMVRDNKRFKMS